VREEAKKPVTGIRFRYQNAGYITTKN